MCAMQSFGQLVWFPRTIQTYALRLRLLMHLLDIYTCDSESVFPISHFGVLVAIVHQLR
jgi:hypothetical protein